LCIVSVPAMDGGVTDGWEVVRLEALVVLGGLVIVGSSAWVLFDAPRRGLSRRWAAACVVLWPAAFLWYLAVRCGVQEPSLDPQAPDPYPLNLPPGYRPPAPMVPPTPRPDRPRSERDAGEPR
jgi:hypothetical protein